MQRPFSTGMFSSGLSLQQLINNLVSRSMPLANRNRTAVVNNVGNEFKLNPGKDAVIPILNELLTAMVANSRDGNIHITADYFQDMLTLIIEERNNYNGYALAYSISSIEPEALMVGGHISIRDPRQKVARVSFTFPNSIAA